MGHAAGALKIQRRFYQSAAKGDLEARAGIEPTSKDLQSSA